MGERIYVYILFLYNSRYWASFLVFFFVILIYVGIVFLSRKFRLRHVVFCFFFRVIIFLFQISCFLKLELENLLVISRNAQLCSIYILCVCVCECQHKILAFIIILITLKKQFHIWIHGIFVAVTYLDHEK